MSRAERRKSSSWRGGEGMTRGSNRKDVAMPGQAYWINYECPVANWEYWEGENRFGQAFTLQLRKEIALALSDFRAHLNSYEAQAGTTEGKRLDVKEIKRELKASIRIGSYRRAEIQRLVESHSTVLPNATVSEKAAYILAEFTACPDDFLAERPMSKPLFTRVLYEIFHRHGMNVSLGSAGTLYGKEGMSPEARAKDAPETPFVEFVRRCIWGNHVSASFCGRIQGLIKNCEVCSKL